jgi:hypothetical protein
MLARAYSLALGLKLQSNPNLLYSELLCRVFLYDPLAALRLGCF